MHWRLLAAAVALLAVLVAALVLVQRPRTRYAPGFSEEQFEALRIGATTHDVISILGEPLSRRTNHSRERWCYGERPAPEPATEERGLLVSRYSFSARPGPPCLVFGTEGLVEAVHRDRDGGLAPLVGLGKPEVLAEVGEPRYREPATTSTVLYYSALDGEDGSYEVRSVVLAQEGRVVEKVAYTLWD